MRKRIKLNLKFNKKNLVVCARSPELCGICKEECEEIELFYYEFSKKDIIECFKNSYKRK